MNLSEPQTQARVVQRWRDLRQMLIHQLEMFESGALTLRTDQVDVSPGAISDLKREILAFDALILEATRPDA